MPIRRPGKVLLALLITLLPAPATTASAAYLYNWDSAQQFMDSANDAPYAPTPGQNILSAWHAFDGTYHYFRIDLESAPAYANPPGYANTYGIYIDSKANGAPNSNGYVPGTLSGIDYIVGSELEFEGRKHTRLDWDEFLQRWKGDEFKDSENLVFQPTGNGGSTLEWRVKEQGKFVLGTSFTWWAATMLPGDECRTKTTYDVMATPIPNAAWLLGSGVLALIGLKRRQSRKA